MIERLRRSFGCRWDCGRWTGNLTTPHCLENEGRRDHLVSVELWYSLDPMRVFILGVGATGSLLAKLLIRQGHEVLCGDRDPVRARAFLGEHSTLVIQRVNARNPCSIVKAAKGCHLLVNACLAVFNKTILRAALLLRSHYIDTASHLTQSPFRL